jgi:hypothetical protein
MLAPKVIVEWITLLIHMRENPGLNFGPETGLLSQVFRAFFSRYYLEIRPLPLPFTSFTIHHLPITFSIDAI